MEQTEKIKRWQIVTKAQTHLAKTKLSCDTRKKHRLNWQRFHDFCLQENVECDFGDVLSLEVAFNQFLMKTSIQEAAMLRSIEYSIKLLKEFILKGTMREPRQSFNFTSPIGQKALEYISEKETENIRPSSLNTYKMQLSRFIDFLTTQKITRIDQLCKEHVFMYIHPPVEKWLQGGHLSCHFVRQTIFKMAIRKQIPKDQYQRQDSKWEICPTTQSAISLLL
jgi:site-specific recombinase XerD